MSGINLTFWRPEEVVVVTASKRASKNGVNLVIRRIPSLRVRTSGGEFEREGLNSRTENGTVQRVSMHRTVDWQLLFQV